MQVQRIPFEDHGPPLTSEMIQVPPLSSRPPYRSQYRSLAPRHPQQYSICMPQTRSVAGRFDQLRPGLFDRF